MERTLGTLPGAVTALLPIHGTPRVLACTDEACLEIDAASGDMSPFANLRAPVAGGGGWDDHAFVVDARGVRHERLGGARATVRSRQEPFEIVRTVVVARDARRIARVASPSTGSFRSDFLEVLDDTWRPVTRHAPVSGDCFEIDRLSLSPDGAWVGLTGMEIAYTSEGDWAWGQQARAVVVACDTGRAAWTLLLGETMRPSEHVAIPLALGDAFWLFGRFALPALDAMKAARTETDLSDEDAPGARHDASGRPRHLLSLIGDGYVALLDGRGPHGPPHLVFGHPGEPVGSDAAVPLGPTVSALTASDGTVLVGYTDGRIVRVER